jgi:hypothetical protein
MVTQLGEGHRRGGGSWSIVAALAGIAIASSQAGCLRRGVRDSVDEYTRPENWNKLREPARALAREVTDGVIAGLDARMQQANLSRAIDDYVSAFLRTASRELDEHIGPAVERQVRAVVAATVDELLAEPVIGRAAAAADRITRAALAAVGDETAATLVADLGPAVAQALEHAIAPALGRALTDSLGPSLAKVLHDDIAAALTGSLKELTPVLAAAARESSEASAGGFIVGAVDELTPKLDELSRRIDEKLARGEHGLRTAAVVVAAGAAALIAILAVLLILGRRQTHDREAALELVTGQIRLLGDEPGVQTLLSRIRAAGQLSKAGDALAAYLRRNPAVRVPRDRSHV